MDRNVVTALRGGGHFCPVLSLPVRPRSTVRWGKECTRVSFISQVYPVKAIVAVMQSAPKMRGVTKKKHAVATATKRSDIGASTGLALNMAARKVEQATLSGQTRRAALKNRLASGIV